MVHKINSGNYFSKEEKLENYIADIQKKLKSEETENEVEIKVFLVDESHDVEYIKNHHSEIQNKILKNLNGKVIFDGTIEDTRYLDTKDYKKSYLKQQGIDVVRIRKQTDFKENIESDNLSRNGKEKYLYTVKSRDENDNSLEYEIEVDENHNEKLKESGLKEIKRSEKYRKELKFFVKLVENGKEVEKEIKIAFDEYIDEKNKKIKPFFEIESNDEKAIKEAIKVLGLEKEKYEITKAGPKKLLEAHRKEQIKTKIEEIDNEEINGIINDFKNAIIGLIETEAIYKSMDEYLAENKEEKENQENISKSNKKLEKFIRKLLIKKINDFIKKDKKYINLFHRILDQTELEKGNIVMGKKFKDKFEREYPGYIKALLKSIKNTFNDNNIAGTPNTIFTKIVKDKINLFLQSLFLFDDSLTKNELEKFLGKSNVSVGTKYEIFNKRVLDMSETLDNKELHSLFLQNSDLKVGHSLLSLYRRAVASVGYEGFQKEKKGKKIEEGADVIKENIEEYVGQLLEYLSHSFSVWLNSPNRDEQTYNGIKDNFLETFYYIYTFKNNNIAFDELYGKEFNQDFINEIIEKYSKKILNKNNFIDFEIEKNILNNFLKNINGVENNKDKIINEYRKAHNNDIKNILIRNKNKIQENTGEETKSLDDKNINFDLWIKLNSDEKLKIFFEKILLENNNGYILNEKIINNSYIENPEIFSKFIDAYFKQKFKSNKILKEGDKLFEEYVNYKKNTLNQLKNTLEKIGKLKNNNLNFLDFVENDVNSFHLIVAWTRFNFKQKKSEEEKIDIDKLDIPSLNYSEKLLEYLSEKKLVYLDKENNVQNELGTNFIATTSDSYNSSIFSEEYVDKLFRRISNGKSINLSSNYYFKNRGIKQYFKNINSLYIPSFENKSENIENIKKYIDLGLETVRNLLNGEKIKNTEYLDSLKNIGFPIKSEVELKKLLEFLKFIKKETFEIINNIYKNGIEDTKYLNENFNNNNFLEKLGITQEDIMIGDAKAEIGLLKKGILKYGGEYVKLGDSTRMTIIQDTVEDLKNVSTKFIKEVSKKEEVKSIWFEDKIGNLFEKAVKPNGYRDSKMTLTLNNGNTIEVQFQLRDYLKAKHDGVEITDSLQNKMEKNILFSKTEKETIVNFCKNTNEKIPGDFKKMFLQDINIPENLYDNNLLIDADFTYRIERSIGDKIIINKLEEIDRILFDELAAGKVTRKEIERILKVDV